MVICAFAVYIYETYIPRTLSYLSTMKPHISETLWLLLALVHSAPSLASESSLIVTTTSGTFRGVSAPAPNNTDKWLGIPFAQPPIGSLRFKAPVPLFVPSPHFEVQDASQFGDACPQEPDPTLRAAMSEDCLNLDVC